MTNPNTRPPLILLPPGETQFRPDGTGAVIQVSTVLRTGATQWAAAKIYWPEHASKLRHEVRANNFIKQRLRCNPQIRDAFVPIYTPRLIPDGLRQNIYMTPGIPTRSQPGHPPYQQPTSIDRSLVRDGDPICTHMLPVHLVPHATTILDIIYKPGDPARFPKVTRMVWLYRLHEVLVHCHAAGIAHSELQLRHILIDCAWGVSVKASVKIIDWGHAVLKDDVGAEAWKVACSRDVHALAALNRLLDSETQELISAGEWMAACERVADPSPDMSEPRTLNVPSFDGS